MTKDVIALTERMPDAWSVLAGLLAGGPELQVQQAADRAVIQLCDRQGRPLLSVETPLLLHSPAEADRLLGTSLGDGPRWWVESRASTAVPEAEQLAGRFAARLALLLGGEVWPPDAPGTADPGTPLDTSAVAAARPPAAAQPAVDVLTERAAVVLQDRPVVPAASWLTDALRAAAESGRSLQVVTPGHCRLSLPTRSLLQATPLHETASRWVVKDEVDGYFDGLSGAVLRWQDGVFAPARDTRGETPVAAAFTAFERTEERQLALSIRTFHEPTADLVLGGALETAWRALTGEPPCSWGSAEPANLRWSREQLTDFAQQRAPEPTWTVVVGSPRHPAIATLRAVRTPTGVVEEIVLTVGYRGDAADRPPLDVLPQLADELATGHGLRSLHCHLREARRDLTVPPRFERPPVPVGFAVGPLEVEELDLDRARTVPLRSPAVRLGTRARPGFYYPLGDGESVEGWTELEALLRHLKPAS
ncbi:DUF6177 family protein [Kitasatospora sp. LaBMicrA B282]|uniref:DUF6177 family protein n=1 Tax=Kitasatospora sp. LaBMicrA B282 TaxID=3420949 RepID=UPI003D125F65